MDKHLQSPFASTQQQMSEHIYAEDTADDLESWRCSDRIPKEVALGIYQNNLHGGVSQHLQTQFPTAHAYIGDQGYQFICANYLKVSPPDQPIFTIFAAHFPGFLIDYGEQHPEQAIWSVAARLAQIDFFHQNTFCEDQRIEVEENYYQLWIALKSIMESEATLPSSGLYQRVELHPERYQQIESKLIALLTFWQEGDLFFRVG
jgi:hypothetical protein